MMLEVFDHEEIIVSDENDEYFKKLEELGILKKIMKKIPFRRNAALVNRIFYKTVCEVDSEKDIYKMSIDSYSSPFGGGILNSILHTKRIFREISVRSMNFCNVDKEKKTVSNINDHEFEALILILSNFSNVLHTFTMSMCLIHDNHLVQIINTLMNSPVQNINITFCGIFAFEFGDKDLPVNSILPQLKSLNFTRSSYGNPLVVGEAKFEGFIQRFLRMLAVTHKDQLKSFSSMKALTPNLDAFSFESLALLNTGPSKIRIAPIISHQYRLKELDLSTTFFMDDVLFEIIKLKFLKKLKINCEAITMKSFSLLTLIDSLKELHLEAKCSTHWLPSVMSMIKFKSVEKLSLHLPNLELPVDKLQGMLRGKFQELSIVTAQAMALQSILTSDTSSYLEAISLEITRANKSTVPILFKGVSRTFREIKSLKIINRNSTIADQSRDVILLVLKLPKLKKLHLEGFKINEQMHHAILKSLKNLEELTLLNYSKELDYVIPSSSKKTIRNCKNLKMMKISCKNSSYSDIARFPVELRRGKVTIFRHR